MKCCECNMCRMAFKGRRGGRGSNCERTGNLRQHNKGCAGPVARGPDALQGTPNRCPIAPTLTIAPRLPLATGVDVTGNGRERESALERETESCVIQQGK